LAGKTFPRLIRSRSQDRFRYTARSSEGTAFLKLEISEPSRRAATLAEEGKWLEKLNASGSLTTPRHLGQGEIPFDDLCGALPDAEQLPPPLHHGIAYYVICEFVPASSGYGIADVALALMEMKRCGVYPGY